MKAPKVSVVMPVYNGGKHLNASIKSILEQQFEDFEFIIINDGSNDNSLPIIHSYKDSRIRLIDFKKNSGLITALNAGFESAIGQYAARMDCDDISSSNRLKVQFSFMNRHTAIGACGSYYHLLRGKKKALVDLPVNNKDIQSFLLFNSPVAHPTAMLRMNLIRKFKLYYSSMYTHAEDYDLWSRISLYADLANISVPLLTYRMHEKQISTAAASREKKLESVSAIRKRHLMNFGISPSEQELVIHNLISDGLIAANINEIQLAEQWLKKLISLNNTNNAFDKNSFQKIVMERWLRLCINFFQMRPGLKYFFLSEIYSIIKLPVGKKIEVAQNLYYSWRRLKIKNDILQV
jgi:glycosyltransferase involved in cell wall biosynthesis